jgi:hypothetical protein
MTGMNKCKLKLKTTMLKGLLGFFVVRSQIVGFFSSTKRRSSMKSPVKNESESKPLPSKEKEKDVAWSRDIRF